MALLVDRPHKPRLIFGSGHGIAMHNVEHWAIKRILRRLNARYAGQRPILVFTDCQAIVMVRGSAHVQYHWLPRTNPLIRHLDKAANALRRSMNPR